MTAGQTLRESSQSEQVTAEGVGKLPAPVYDRRRRSRLAEACLGLALLSFLIWGAVSFTAPAVAGLAVFLGLLALRSIARNSGRLTGQGLALWGIGVGVVHMALSGYAYTVRIATPA